MTKPHADIRRALVELARGEGRDDRTTAMLAAAEVLITTIDNMEKYGAGDVILQQFQMNYAHFLRVAAGQPFPPVLSPAEIAKAFGLGEGEGA